ncbi:MAG: acetolactate synthase-1/2/3 large subunit [Candidatus Azotimanducaceae bacterium]|jgi:acetolactate synthase-1/2/3 large subunit
MEIIMGTRTGAEVIVDTLINAGVKHVFGIVSIHNMPIVDAISRSDAINMVTARNEQSATHMADGYARAKGALGVALGSTGPGTTNMVTGIYESAYASSRVLVITGQAETTFYGKGKGYVHEAEKQKQMLETVARTVASPRYVDDIAPLLGNVIDSICHGRPQPGAIEVPIDLQYATTQTEPHTPAAQSTVLPTSGAINQALDKIKHANKRVILAGGGINTPEAAAALQKFAELLDAPVITTPNGKGAIRSDHPLHLGPIMMSKPILEAVNEADVLIAVGTRFQAGVAGNQLKISLPPLIHIDLDPRTINLNFTAQVGIISDATPALTQLTDSSIEKGDSQYREKLQSLAAETRAQTRERIGVDHAKVLDAISEYMEADTYFVRDNTIPGYHWGNGLLPINNPRGYIYPTSGAIGPGLPLGIGVAVATDKKTIVMHGDGGFMFHVGELSTAAQYQAPIVVIIFNDGGYGVLRGLQHNQFEGRFNETELNTPDFVQLAESMGVKGLHADNAEELKTKLAEAMAIKGPVLINLNVHNMIPVKGVVTAPGR